MMSHIDLQVDQLKEKDEEIARLKYEINEGKKRENGMKSKNAKYHKLASKFQMLYEKSNKDNYAKDK